MIEVNSVVAKIKTIRVISEGRQLSNIEKKDEQQGVISRVFRTDVNALVAIPSVSTEYFFWKGESKLENATGDWQRTQKAVFEEAKILDGHAHRFHDTFAVSLLQAGVPMERVSVLLGHSSIKVTEKYYSPWVAARQEQLESDVRRSWGEHRPERLIGLL